MITEYLDRGWILLTGKETKKIVEKWNPNARVVDVTSNFESIVDDLGVNKYVIDSWFNGYELSQSVMLNESNKVVLVRMDKRNMKCFSNKKPYSSLSDVNEKEKISFVLRDGSVPEVIIEGESVPVVSCSYQYVTCGLGNGVNMFVATVLTGCDNDLCGVTQSVIYHNNLTGETYFQ